MAVVTEPEVTEVTRDMATLLEALRMLERDGWCQGLPNTPSGERCLVNALGSTNNGRLSISNPVFDALRKATGVRDLVGWNDAPERTFDEIRLVILDAVEILETL